MCIADADGPFRAPFESVGLLTAPNEDSEAHSDVRSEAVFPSGIRRSGYRAEVRASLRRSHELERTLLKVQSNRVQLRGHRFLKP